MRTHGIPISNEYTSRVRIYLKVREISDDLWCHWFRAQRASFYVFVRGMNAFQLKEWFEWKSMDTPGHYVRQTLKGIAEQMGIEKNSFVMRAFSLYECSVSICFNLLEKQPASVVQAALYSCTYRSIIRRLSEAVSVRLADELRVSLKAKLLRKS